MQQTYIMQTTVHFTLKKEKHPHFALQAKMHRKTDIIEMAKHVQYAP